jgi:hypothetical protein
MLIAAVLEIAGEFVRRRVEVIDFEVGGGIAEYVRIHRNGISFAIIGQTVLLAVFTQQLADHIREFSEALFLLAARTAKSKLT